MTSTLTRREGLARLNCAVDGKAALEAGLERWAKRKAAPVEGEPLAPAGLISNDAPKVYQLPDGSFEMYSVALMQVDKNDPRYAAQDNLSGLVRVITPDANDPHDLQFYYLSVTHTERGRIGLLDHYRLDAQTIDLEACFSTDGITWQRPQRQAWITRDVPGTTAETRRHHAGDV